MTIRGAAMKAPGEKLLRVRLDINGGTVSAARISGDFFIHPEEAVAMLEDALKGPCGTRAAVLARLEKAVISGNIELVGLSIVSIADCTLRAASMRDAGDG